MNSNIENNLTSLIPTLAGPLPPELIQLATSLVAQSKIRISSLKPGEEICREYVCAHIACDRLRTQLDLPTITPRPPLPKKTYGALYTQFQKALPLRTRPTPTATTTTITTTTDPSTSTPTPPEPTPLPPALRTTIHTLITALSAPGAHRHVIAGTTLLLPESPRNHLPLVTAITLLTIERLLPEGKNVTVGSAGKWRRGEGYIMKRDGVMGALGGVGKGFTKEDTDGWVKELSRRGIRELPWLSEVPDGAGLKVRAGDKVEVELIVGTAKKGRRTAVRKAPAKKKKEEEKPEAEGETQLENDPQQDRDKDELAPAEVKVPQQKKAQTRARQKTAQQLPPAKRQKVQRAESTIGSFVQGSVDYLSENKRRSYKVWEANMLARVAEYEAGPPSAPTVELGMA